MSGICGMVSFQPELPADQFVLQQIHQPLRHPGPDGEDYYQDSQVRLAMGRISIIDLHTKQQSISNETGYVWVVHNGGKYNFKSARAELESQDANH
jgi:asparagine synthase (glutamine-hydrolysing)